MAVTGSFRQQCPSCEAMVLIKDPKQVGKKIDCPNCKFRFVVEDPAEKEVEEPAEEEAKPKAKAKSSSAVTAKKPAPPPPTQPAIKKKGGPKKPAHDEDEDEEDRPKKKAKSGNMVVILGVGLAACALIVLGVGGYFLFIAGKDNGSSAGPITRSQVTGRGTSRDTTKKESSSSDPKLVEISNLLPNESQNVLNLNVKDLVNGSIGRAAFDTPGAFKKKELRPKLGMSIEDIDQLLLAWNSAKGWTFAVIRTDKPLATDFKTVANLQTPPDSPYKKQEYFLTEPSDWLDRVWSAISEQPLGEPKQRQFALRVVDPQTLVVTDSIELLKAFLDENGQPKPRTKPDAKGPSGQQVGKRYLTVSPELKGLLDQLEVKPAILTWAMETGTIREALLPAAVAQLKLFGLAVDDRLLTALSDMRVMGLAVQTKDQTAVTLGLDFREHKTAQETQDVFRMKTDELVKTNLPGRGNLPAWSPIACVVEIDGRQAIAPAGMPLPPAPPPVMTPKITVKSQVQVQTFMLTAEIMLSSVANSMEIQNRLAPLMVRLHGAVEMAVPQPRMHELANAVMAMAQKDGKFPRGTFARPIDKDRRGRPYEPDDRVSWMIELLPYLDLTDVRRQIKTERSWRDPENAAAAICLVPALLDPASPSNTWWMRLRLGQVFATTQWVGMAGVGLDAAEYAADDTAAARKLGIFGYDRETKLDDVKDRASTIALIQVPAADVPDKDIRGFRRPWLAGGGATVAGVPEKGSVKPFVCGQYEMGGNKVWGTFAIMADGKVRFIPETISDDVFKALCAIAGDKKKVDLAKDTVEVPPPGKAILKAKE
jgi:hypothetical protein